jgi:hypothetical protein
VTNDATIIIIMLLTILLRWSAGLIDVQGDFIFGNFKDGETGSKSILGIIEEILDDIKYETSLVDPCLYFFRTMTGLII